MIEIDVKNAKTMPDGASRRGADEKSFAQMVIPHFQPIYDMREGRVVGFEALARLDAGAGLLAPAQFLHLLDTDGLLRLFCAMLAKSIVVMQGLDPSADRLYVAINVNASIVLRDDFVDLVRFIVFDHAFEPGRLVIEILEGEAIVSTQAMSHAILRLKALGISVALDDIGSAYASLSNLKDLPVDIFKLDQTFSRMLSSRPEDLQFISSMIGLARGLNRKLVVEGAETPEIVEALRIIGVEYAQGYALARPMVGAAIRGWLQTSSIQKAESTPHTLLGVYAAHLGIAEACRVLAKQPLRLRWHDDAIDPHRCIIGKYLDRHGLHETAYGHAHKRFHRVLGRTREGGTHAWEKAAEELRQALLIALRRDLETTGTHKCDGVAERQAG